MWRWIETVRGVPVTNAFWSWPLIPVLQGPIVPTIALLRQTRSMHTAVVSNNAATGRTRTYTHFVVPLLDSGPFTTEFVGVPEPDGAFGSDGAGAGDGFLPLLWSFGCWIAGRRPLPVDGTGTTFGRTLLWDTAGRLLVSCNKLRREMWANAFGIIYGSLKPAGDFF